MMSQHAEQIYRTTPARVGRMMAIMLGICIVGGAIFFGMWDYWISEIPPVVQSTAPPPPPPAVATGETIPVSLSFVESDEGFTYGFNEVMGMDGANPTIEAVVGDEIVFDVVNDGVLLHAFGVTQETEGIGGVIPGTEIGLPSAPLLAGESGTASFVPSEPGEYYYICTVAGHRELGMVGTIMVGEAEAEEPAEAAPPTGVSHSFDVSFVESDDFITLGFNQIRGEDGANPEFRVDSGDEVTFTVTNAGLLFHSFGVVTNPLDLNSVVWDSGIRSAANPFKQGEVLDVTFVAGAPGTYYYICTVQGHAAQGMQGTFIVE